MPQDATIRTRRSRYIIVAIALVLLLVALVALNIGIGSVNLSIREILSSLFSENTGTPESDILFKVRLPRLLAGMILGGALALSGFLLQTFFNNPIAGPYVLGISSGAKLAVALVMVFVLSRGGTVSSSLLIVSAFAGSLLSMGFVMLIAQRVRRASVLIVSGVMIGYICSAITDFVVTFASDESIVNLHNWSLGSFSGTSWNDVGVMALVVFLASALVFLLSKPIGAYQLGESYALSVGVNIKAFRAALVLLSSILCACVTAFAGPISFVGIAVPHLIKSFTKTAKPILIIPLCFLGGAVFCLGCDLIARTVYAPVEMSVSSVSSLLGAPVVIYILAGRAKLAGKSASRKAMSQSGAPGNAPPARGGGETASFFQAERLSVGYGNQPVIEDIGVALKKGQVLTLIGPNGSGKSTVLKSVVKQLAPLGGSVYIGGEAIESIRARAFSRRAAVVLTERPKPELMTCWDVAAAGRYPYTGMLGILSEADREKVTDALRTVNALDIKDRSFAEVSDGQLQRVLLARAICQEPEILVLDEPTSYLDIRYAVGILDTLIQMARERGALVILSLHELNYAKRVSDLVMCVKDSRVLYLDTPDKIFTDEIISRLYDLPEGYYEQLFGGL